jgi:hypothetical protein
MVAVVFRMRGITKLDNRGSKAGICETRRAIIQFWIPAFRNTIATITRAPPLARPRSLHPLTASRCHIA